MPEEVMFVLLWCNCRADSRIGIGTTILKKVGSIIIPGIRDVIPYPKGKDGAINPR